MLLLHRDQSINLAWIKNELTNFYNIGTLENSTNVLPYFNGCPYSEDTAADYKEALELRRPLT